MVVRPVDVEPPRNEVLPEPRPVVLIDVDGRRLVVVPTLLDPATPRRPLSIVLPLEMLVLPRRPLSMMVVPLLPFESMLSLPVEGV